MIYQLPNGKVLWLTTEEYLSLSDEDLNLISNLGYGDTANSPWTGSAISSKAKSKPLPNPDDDSMDYSLVYEDHGSDSNVIISIEEIDIEDLEIPDGHNED